MSAAFGQRLRALRTEYRLLQSAFADQCGISSAYLSDIERGKRFPPRDDVILTWAGYLDTARAEEIGRELLELAARDRGRAEAVTEVETEDAGGIWSSVVRGKGDGTDRSKGRTPFLDYFTEDMVDQARVGRLDPAPGRAAEFDEITCALSRRRRNSVLLSCESGGEIRRVVHGWACALAVGESPEGLGVKRLLQLDGIQTGVKYRGQFEERLKALVDELAPETDAVLYCHGLCDLVELEGNAKGSFFRPALEEGRIRMITGATPGELAEARKVKPDLVACFSEVAIGPMGREEVLRELQTLAERYGQHHGVEYSDGALVAVVDAAEVSSGPAQFHQRALDLLDEVGARARLAGEPSVAVESVDRVTGRDEGS